MFEGFELDQVDVGDVILRPGSQLRGSTGSFSANLLPCPNASSPPIRSGGITLMARKWAPTITPTRCAVTDPSVPVS
jgi:hypothetical protein